jgi:hypothetical protein
MPNRVTTGIPSGVTNAVLGSALETYIGMDPSTVHQYFNDFDIYTVGDWTPTATQVGVPTNAIAAGNGGILSLANSTTSADLDQLTLKAATFAFIAGQQVWFKARFQIADATNSSIILGLQNLNTNAFAATDGVWFSKIATSTTMSAVVAASSTSTTSSAPSNLTVANATWANVGFYYDGAAMNLYFNDTSTGNVSVANLPAASTNLAVTIAVKNGTAAGQTLLLDYIMAAAERQVDSTHVG